MQTNAFISQKQVVCWGGKQGATWWNKVGAHWERGSVLPRRSQTVEERVLAAGRAERHQDDKSIGWSKSSCHWLLLKDDCNGGQVGRFSGTEEGFFLTES